ANVTRTTSKRGYFFFATALIASTFINGPFGTTVGGDHASLVISRRNTMALPVALITNTYRPRPIPVHRWIWNRTRRTQTRCGLRASCRKTLVTGNLSTSISRSAEAFALQICNQPDHHAFSFNRRRPFTEKVPIPTRRRVCA